MLLWYLSRLVWIFIGSYYGLFQTGIQEGFVFSNAKITKVKNEKSRIRLPDCGVAGIGDSLLGLPTFVWENEKCYRVGF